MFWQQSGLLKAGWKFPFLQATFKGWGRGWSLNVQPKLQKWNRKIPKRGFLQTASFLCPQEGFVRVFQRLSSLERHLSLDACTKTLERQTLADTAKVQYASLLQEGAGSTPTFIQTSPNTDGVTLKSSLQEGWALMSTKKIYWLNDKQKEYLEAMFDIGQSTERKMDPDVVAKKIRRARNVNGQKIFLRVLNFFPHSRCRPSFPSCCQNTP